MEKCYFSIKTRDAETVPKILAKESGIVFDGINILQDALVLGSPVFIVLGGDRPKWDTGLIGIGVVSGTPFDKGYDEKNKNNFKVKIDMKVLLHRTIKREDLIPYRDTYGIIAIGPVLKGEPNQALTTVSEKQAIALMRAMAELSPDVKTDTESLAGEEVSNKIFGVTNKMVEIPFVYGQTEENAIEQYVKAKTNVLDEEAEEKNKIRFKEWLGKQVKSDDDSDETQTYSDGSVYAYVTAIGAVKVELAGQERSLYACIDHNKVKEVYEQALKKENTGHRKISSAIKKYMQYLGENQGMSQENSYIPIVFNTSISSKYERNRIVFGAPGTGKSYELKEDCEKLLKNTNGSYERVTFHPDYSYSQFVGTYKPVMGADEKIRYDFVPGPFMRVYVEALKSGRTENPQPHLLLIEEINRAKVAAVFGDVFQLLDRDDDGVSEYEIQASEDIRKYLAKQLGGNPDNYQKIRIPNNMFIWSTMNSADQGVFPMDTAFKRRWNFEYLGINENEEKISGIGKIELAGSDEPVEWNILRRAINAKMSSEQFKINEDKLMGPFFLSKKIIASDENGMIIDTDKFVAAFKSKVIMYLYEDAVKQGKHRFFDGCDNSKYSSVCDAFDELGMGIFGPNFKENFYDKQRDEV